MKNRFITAMFMAITAISPVWAEVDTSRIVSVDANATEILIGLGFQSHLVAVDVTSQSLVSEMGLPDLGYHRALSAEGVLSTAPSMVIGSTHMGPPPVVATLKGSDIPLIQLEAASTVDGLITNIETVGALVNKPQDARLLIDNVNSQMEVIASNSDSPKSMVFLLNMSGRGLSKAGEGTTGEALIQILGGDNLSDYSGYKTIAIEALLELDPDVILVGSRDSTVDAAEDLLQNNPLLAHTSAAKNERVISVDAAKMVAGVSLGVMAEATRLSALISGL